MSTDPEKLRILTTGGTFDKIYPTGLWSVEFVFRPLPATAVSDILQRASVRSGYPVEPALPSAMDSTDIESAERAAIVEKCARVPEMRIVIIHGTDTMVDYEHPKTNEIKEGTATALGNAKHLSEKTIILTGASQPACVRDTDADFNLGFAIGAALFYPKSGVFIAMNGEVFCWNKCRKTDSGAFISKPRLGLRATSSA